QPVAGVRRHERPAPAVLLDSQLAHLGAREGLHELVLVEREAEVIDARQLPLAGLDDDVDRTTLELGEAQLEAGAVEVLPAVTGLERRPLLADPAVPRDQVEPELPEIPGLDLPHLARHQVVVEQSHALIRANRKPRRFALVGRIADGHAGKARMPPPSAPPSRRLRG